FLRSDYLALLVWFAAGVLVSSALPGAEAISEADKQRAVKAGLAFVKAVLAMLFPPPTPAAKFYKADFSDTNAPHRVVHRGGTFEVAQKSVFSVSHRVVEIILAVSTRTKLCQWQ
ncbi:unnamed protein product, partial [Closterium sp. NIES-53]